MENKENNARWNEASKRLLKYGFVLREDNTINLEHLTMEIGGKEFEVSLDLSAYFTNGPMTLDDVENILSAFDNKELSFDDILERLSDVNEWDTESTAEN